MASVTPSEFVRPGAVVFVVWSDRTGVSKWARREVAKIGAQHFTVHGIYVGGESRPDSGLVKFRNRGRGSHDATGDNGPTVIEDGTARVHRIERELAERLAVERVTQAGDAWERIVRERRSPYPEKRPSAAAVDEALVELTNAALAAREALGVPGGQDEN